MLRRALLLGSFYLLFSPDVMAQTRPAKFDATQVGQLLYLPTVGLIGLIGEGNRPAPDAQLSADSEALVQEMLLSYTEPLHLGPQVKTDTATQQRLRREVLRATAAKLRGARQPTPPMPTLDSVLADYQPRYVLATVSQGFTRVKGNYGQQSAKALGIGLLTLGMYAPVPLKASSNLHAFVYDRQQREIVFFNTDAWPEKEPLEPRVVDQQVQKVLSKAFRFPAQP